MREHSSFNLVGKTAHFFASNKPLSFLLFISVIILGFSAFALTPKQYNPEIVRPAFTLELSYEGATPRETVDRVVYELVEKISAVPGVDEIFTEASDGGHVGTTVIFDVGYDKEKAKVELIAQIEQHSYLAQGFITPPRIAEVNPETIPVMQIVFSSPSLSIAEVRARVTELARSFTVIPEVSDVSITGGYEPALVISVDPTRLSGAGVALGELMGALTSGQSRMVLSGYENDAHTVGVVFDGKISTPEEVGALFVTPSIRVRDVAAVYEGALPDRSYTLHDTKDIPPTEVVMLSVSKVEGSSAPNVTGAVRERLETILREERFAELSYTVVSDDGVTATNEIRSLTINLLQSIAIVAMVLMIFLSFRAASIVLVAIPTTLLIVFGLGLLFDQTINRITLFALILSLGLLVDAAIVVVENMYVHLKRASAGVVNATRDLIIAGSVDEIGVGLFLSTLTSVLVFLPVGYITGMMGPYMGPIAFFVPAALIVSMFIAIILVPFMASYLLRVDEEPTRFSVWIDTQTERLIRSYKDILERIVHSRALQKKVLLGSVGAFCAVLILPLTGLEHFQMLPRADRDQFYVYIDAPIDTSLQTTKSIAENVSALISEDPDVTSIQQFIGVPPIVDFNGMFKGAQFRNGKHEATFRVNLTDAGERERSSTDIVSAIRHKIAQDDTEHTSMVRFVEEPPGPPVRSTLVAKVSSLDSERTAEAVERLFPYIAGIEGVVDPYVSYDAPTGNIVYSFDHEKAAAYGVKESEVMAMLKLYAGNVPVTEYRGNGPLEYTPVTIALSRDRIDEVGDIGELVVRGKDGIIPLTSVLDTSYALKEQALNLERGKELVYITGELEERPILYVILDIVRGLMLGKLDGYTVSDWDLFALTLQSDDGDVTEIEWGGEWEMTLENFRDLGIAMGVALVLVYATLVAQYHSFKKPAFIMVTVPLGLIGILIGFLFLDTFFGIYLTATALIGFIALIGIVVNNAIILSEYIDQEIQGGAAYTEALVEAGGARFRPILLTSLTTVLGSLTIAGDPVWSGLAWAIFFGLSLSTALALIVYPTLLIYFYRQGD